MPIDRNYAKALCERYFPEEKKYYTRKCIGMAHITKDWTNGGTTCGYLPHWLLWKLGCSDENLVNRKEPDSPFVYKDGQNLARISSYKQAWTGYNPVDKSHIEGFKNGSRRPKTGDFVIIKGEDFIGKNGERIESSHIFVVLNEGSITGNRLEYKIAETGAKSGNEEAGHRTTKEFNFSSNKWIANENLAQGVKRFIIGWLDIDKCPYGSLPEKGEVVVDILSLVAKESSTGIPSNNQVIGFWYVVSNNYLPGWFYMFHNGYRVFYAKADQPNLIQGSGYWYSKSGIIYIVWTNETSEIEKITLNSTNISGILQDNSNSEFFIAKMIHIAPVVLNSYKNNRGLPMGSRKI